ncbi:hypothetical protein EGW08_020302 [Elysia chlorotica]|uniref:Uncharacterized protein n=1 Tax=Elysia chlorotica TaxID=188477 RepID=A0A3S0Z6T1_ELYCH|nr:hypothetical protein EGW08_020302 [Elysia chlorotica]
MKLTDSSLAWHLMEAHEHTECITCRSSVEDENEKSQDFGVLQDSLVSCVQNFFEFENYINLVGCLSLDFGGDRKLNVKFRRQVQREPECEAQGPQEPLLRQTCSPLQPLSSELTTQNSPALELKSSPEALAEATTPHKVSAACPAAYTAEGESPIATAVECRSFNLSSCSVESGLSVEIDVVGTDSSQEIIPEEGHDDGTIEMHAEAAEEPISKEQATEKTHYMSSPMSTHNPELKFCDNSSLISKPEEVSLYQPEGVAPGDASDIDTSEQISESQIEASSFGSGCHPVPTKESCSAEQLDQRKDVHSSGPAVQLADRPLDMSLFKSDGNGRATPQK